MSILLAVDAVINFGLGILLLFYSPALADKLGVPIASSAFYPNILGAVLFGIGIALVFGATKQQRSRHHGLGFWGAVSINLCGGTTLALWLIFANLGLPVRGYIFLWLLVSVLVLVSAAEALFSNKR